MSNIIAIVWDFDKTLINGNMEDPLLEDYKLDPAEFWAEVEALPKKYLSEQGVKVNPDTIYLNQFIKFAKSGKLAGLNNAKLREYGSWLKFYPGVPEIFETTRKIISDNQTYQKHGIKLEHYIISAGLKEIIRGSAVAAFVEDIWACEFIEIDDGNGGKILGETAYTIDNTTKTRALFEINKGVGKNENVFVNTFLPEEHRRVHFKNMIYVADGPSDVPAFSVLNKNGGVTFAVYPAGNVKALKQVEQLRQENRINYFAEADYSDEKTASMWLCLKLVEIADRICADENLALSKYTDRKPPQHLN